MSLLKTLSLTSLAMFVTTAPSYALRVFPSPASEPSMLSIMAAIGIAGLLFKIIRK